MIKSKDELIEEIGADTIDTAKTAVHKSTKGKSRIEIEFDGVTVNTTFDKLHYPFEPREFWALLGDESSPDRIHSVFSLYPKEIEFIHDIKESIDDTIGDCDIPLGLALRAILLFACSRQDEFNDELAAIIDSSLFG